MTLDEIRNMPAGKELNEAILKEVYELEVKEGDTVPDFSGKTADAMLLAEFISGNDDMEENSFQLTRPSASIKLWVASFHNRKFVAGAETLALSVARASLIYAMGLTS